jgi:nitroreductase
MEQLSTHTLAAIIKNRRTRKPALFTKTPPPRKLIQELIEIARHAPNHHRTEPARFYLLDQLTIQKLGKLFGEVLSKDSDNPVLVEKGKRKSTEWGEAPGVLILTCLTDKTSDLIKKNPSVIDEDYATCACIGQNLLLLFESENIASKWSTGPVWEHSDFAETIGMIKPESERVIGIFFYGYSEQKVPPRQLTPLNNHLWG